MLSLFWFLKLSYKDRGEGSNIFLLLKLCICTHLYCDLFMFVWGSPAVCADTLNLKCEMMHSAENSGFFVSVVYSH